MKKLLSLDLGSNSIGWVFAKLNEDGWPDEIVDTGVRIFHNSRGGKGGNTPLTVTRREARGARRRRDRLIQRKNYLVDTLIKYSLLPESAEERHKLKVLDPYKIRVKALDKLLTPYELGRALIHLNQRRGFKSNRKDLNKKEGGTKLGDKVSKLKDILEGRNYRTLGEFLFNELKDNGSCRLRPEGSLYPIRDMYKDEFDLIRKTQTTLGLNLSDEKWDLLESIIFKQRPLKIQEVGFCTFKTDKKRARKALSSFQRHRFLQQLANLKIIEVGKPAQSLSKDQYEILVKELSSRKEYKYDAIRKKLDLPTNSYFNLEEGKGKFKSAKHIYGDRSTHLLSHKDYFGKQILNFSTQEKDIIINKIIETSIHNKEAELEEFLKKYDLSSEQIINIIDNINDESFEQSYGNLCSEILLEIEKEFLSDHLSTYDKALDRLGYHHSDFRGEKRSRLPYYGEIIHKECLGIKANPKNDEEKFGRITNPTVHVCLNQLRKVVNKIIDKYGPLDQIIVEVARDLPLGEKSLKELKNKNNQNEKENDRINEILLANNQKPNYSNRRRYKLWEELSSVPTQRSCPYSGKQIGIEKLFSHEVQEDHILPKSLTRKNNISNMVLCLTEANQIKKNKSPYQAFYNHPDYDWEGIIARASLLPKYKSSMFAEDALEKFKSENNFLESQLNDTKYISRVARRYVESVCSQVSVCKGIITASVRDKIRLHTILYGDTKKNREDHRHHALDAFVLLFCTPKGFLKLENHFNSYQPNEDDQNRISLLIEQFKNKLLNMVVSHKVDHGANSSNFFKDTAYGKSIIDNVEVLTERKRIEDLQDKHELISKELDKLHKEGSLPQSIKKVKIKYSKSPEVAESINHKEYNIDHYKYLIPGDNYHITVWKKPDGSLKFESQSPFEVVKDIKNNTRSDKPHPAAKKIFDIRKGDTFALTENGSRRIVVIESLKPANEVIIFSNHNRAINNDAKGRSLSYSSICKKQFRPIYVDEIGHVYDNNKWWA